MLAVANYEHHLSSRTNRRNHAEPSQKPRQIVPVSGKRDPMERIRGAIAEPSQKPPNRSSFSEARHNGRNQSRNRRVDQNRQEEHGDEKCRNRKKTLGTAFFSDPIIS